jgi:hypothetical protein
MPLALFLGSGDEAMEPNFKKRRKIAAFTCIITIIVLVLNTRCSTQEPMSVSPLVTQKSDELIHCDKNKTLLSTVYARVAYHAASVTQP